MIKASRKIYNKTPGLMGMYIIQEMMLLVTAHVEHKTLNKMKILKHTGIRSVVQRKQVIYYDD